MAAIFFTVAAIATVALFAVNAARDPDSSVATRPTGEAPPPSVAASPTLPPDPQAATKAAVIAAYAQSYKAIIVVGKEATPNVNDSRLSEHTTGPALIAKQRAVADNKAKGLVYVGDAQLHPTVIELTADTATVVDCALDRTALVEARTGTTVVDAGPNEGAVATAKMKLDGGVWKVTDFKNEKRSCVPPAA